MGFPSYLGGDKKKMTVLYRSGNKVHFTAKKFSVTRYADGHIDIEWEGLSPKVLLFGVDDVEAVWEGWV